MVTGSSMRTRLGYDSRLDVLGTEDVDGLGDNAFEIFEGEFSLFFEEFLEGGDLDFSLLEQILRFNRSTGWRWQVFNFTSISGILQKFHNNRL